MLHRPTLAVLLLVTLLPAPAFGQASNPPIEVLTDPAGDVRSEVSGTAGPPATALYPAADILALEVEEAKHAFTFRLRMAALPTAQDPGLDGVNYEVLFEHNGRQFQVVVWRVLEFTQSVSPQPSFAWLAFRDSADEAWQLLWFSETAPMFDESAKTVAIEVLRLDLVDAQGATPFPGRALTGIRAEAHGALEDAQVFTIGGTGAPGWPQRFVDLMPDDPGQAAALPVAIGPAQTGHARLTSFDPFRASNGEATTFLYEVTAHNLDDADDRFELSASAVPHGYSLTLPVPIVDIPARSTVDVPVLLTMPFGHQHGATAAFTLEMRSLSDERSVGRIELGVRFLAIPQPAGHHDTVFLHRSPAVGGVGPLFGFHAGYLNTLEDDPNDSKQPLPSNWLSITGTGRIEARWFFPLEPGLSMGLDVDPASSGHLRFALGSKAPLQDTEVQALLRVAQGADFPQEDGVVLARLQELPPMQVGPNGDATVEGELVVEPGVGRIPYERGLNLWLEVIVTTTGQTWSASDEGAYIAPGGMARLPLREWHDPVDDVLAALNGPGLSPLGPQERLANPGKTVVFPVAVANPLGHAVTVQFELTGPNAEWAALSNPTLTAPANGVAQASVIIRVPPGAGDGERADLVLQAYSKDDPTARGLLRLVAEVDTQAQHPDDAALAPAASAKESPGAGAVLAALAALAALALARRRP
jgi:hypothetical protein